MLKILSKAVAAGTWTLDLLRRSDILFTFLFLFFVPVDTHLFLSAGESLRKADHSLTSYMSKKSQALTQMSCSECTTTYKN